MSRPQANSGRGACPVNPFDYLEYRHLLSDAIAATPRRRGSHATLARAAGCKSSYLSQVLAQKAHLTPDHAAGIAEFWELTPLEMDYFLALVHFSRAGTKALQSRLSNQLDELRIAHRDLFARLKPDTTLRSASIDSAIYYSSWRWLAVHMLLGVPGLRTASAIAARLHLSEALVEETLLGLEKMSLVVNTSGNQWQRTNHDLHLPKAHPMMAVCHASLRHLSAYRIEQGHRQGLFYGGIHTASKRDAEKIQELFTDALATAREIIRPSPDESGFCLLCDVFPL